MNRINLESYAYIWMKTTDFVLLTWISHHQASAYRAYPNYLYSFYRNPTEPKQYVCYRESEKMDTLFDNLVCIFTHNPPTTGEQVEEARGKEHILRVHNWYLIVHGSVSHLYFDTNPTKKIGMLNGVRRLPIYISTSICLEFLGTSTVL